MGWNGSNQSKTAASRPGGQSHAAKSENSGLTYFLIFTVVVAIAAAAYFVLRGNRGGQSPGEQPEPSGGKIAEVVPATNAPTQVERPTATDEGDEEVEVPYWEVDASKTNGFSAAMMKKWEHRHRPKYKFDLPKRELRAKYRIFRHRSENEIAALLMAKPGASMIGRPRYQGLTEDFMKSCEEPIIVTADDDEYTAKLKRDMIQAKIELRQRMADGESLEKIIEDTRAEFRKLSDYKRTLTKEVMDMIRKEDVGEADVDLFVEAANKMLDAKGIAPIKISEITRQWIINNKGDL